MIDEKETFRLFGYYSKDLKPKSRKKIVAVCDNPDCEGNKVRIIQKGQYKSLCRSCAQKKRYEDPLEREKARQQQIKRYEDPLEREKKRQQQIKRWSDPLEREKARDKANKRWEDPLEREKARERANERYEDPLEREKTGNGVKKFYIDNLDARNRARENMINQWEDPKGREKLIDGQIEYINDNPEQVHIDRMKAGLASVKSQDGKSSSIEFKIRKILEDNNYQFTINTPLLNMCIPDIVFKDEKVIIQCDGDYWHDYPNGTDRDYYQDKILKQNGWQVIRFWEHEINNDIEGCLETFEWETFRRFNQ